MSAGKHWLEKIYSKKFQGCVGSKVSLHKNTALIQYRGFEIRVPYIQHKLKRKNYTDLNQAFTKLFHQINYISRGFYLRAS